MTILDTGQSATVTMTESTSRVIALPPDSMRTATRKTCEPGRSPLMTYADGWPAPSTGRYRTRTGWSGVPSVRSDQLTPVTSLPTESTNVTRTTAESPRVNCTG